MSPAASLLILLDSNAEVAGPFPLDDKMDFLAPAPEFKAAFLAVALVAMVAGFFAAVKSSVDALGVMFFDDNGDGVELIGLDQLEKKSLEPPSDEESFKAKSSVESSSVTMSGCFSASSCAFCFNLSLYFCATGDVYFDSELQLLLRKRAPPFFIKNSLATWLPPNLKLRSWILCHESKLDDLTNVMWTPKFACTAEHSIHNNTPKGIDVQVGFALSQSKHTWLAGCDLSRANTLAASSLDAMESLMMLNWQKMCE